MARAAREKSPSGIYKMILRSSGDMFSDDEDRREMTERIEKYLDVYAYTILKSAVCIIAKESKRGISADMKPMTTSYARYFNKKYNKGGKLYSDRFKSAPVSAERLIHEAAAVGRLAETAGESEIYTYFDKDRITEPEFERELKAVTEADGFYSVLLKKEDSRTVKQKEAQPIPEPKAEPAQPVAPKMMPETDSIQPAAPEPVQPDVPESSPVPAANKRKRKQMPSWLL